MASNKKKTTTVTTKKKKTICPTTNAAAGITKSMEEQVAELFANMKAKDAQIESLLEEKQQRGTCNTLLIPSPSMCVLYEHFPSDAIFATATSTSSAPIHFVWRP
jgi:hypothetical protein